MRVVPASIAPVRSVDERHGTPHATLLCMPDSNHPPNHPSKKTHRLEESFRHFASLASDKLGSHWAFMAALTGVVIWAASGPLFHWSETWQLVINTGTTIITFLMVFLIQSTQNRDAKALHLKLDELIRSSRARNAFVNLEHASDEELATFQQEFEALRAARAKTAATERATASAATRSAH